MENTQNNRLSPADRLGTVVKSIGSRAQLVSRTLKPDSGLEATRYRGFLIGFLIALFVVLLVPLSVSALIGGI